MYNLDATQRSADIETKSNIGYGLYISKKIATGLGGTLDHDNTRRRLGILRKDTKTVTFTAIFPVKDI